MTENDRYKICVDDKECISCGTCLHTCVHAARHFHDDYETFFSELQQGRQLSVLVAPSFFLSYPKEYKRIFGYLKSLGVKNFYPVSFGADITTWGYINYLKKNNAAGKIAQPCPTVVTYIEKHLPELLPNLIPVQSPLMCTAIYLKRYLGIQEDLVFLGPCIAKKSEIQSKRGLGLVRHNITFKNIMRRIKEQGVDLACCPEVEETLEAGMGSLFPKPGGLGENIEYYMGPESSIVQLEGERKVYEYLHHFAKRVKDQSAFIPALVDVLNCHKGCGYGPGSEIHNSHNDDISYQAILMRKKKYNTMKGQDEKVLLDPDERFAQLNNTFKDLKLEDFMCEYQKDETASTRIVMTMKSRKCVSRKKGSV
jgi:iron only hydrogenase large subunit-like protein